PTRRGRSLISCCRAGSLAAPPVAASVPLAGFLRAGKRDACGYGSASLPSEGPMPTDIADAPAWRADTLDDPSRWYYRLSDRCLSALRDAARPGRGRPVTDLSLDRASRA